MQVEDTPAVTSPILTDHAREQPQARGRIEEISAQNGLFKVEEKQGGSFAVAVLSLLPGRTAWRSRKVQYYSGDWASIQAVLPEFDLKPFTAGQDEPPNPFLQTVMRKPLSAAERPIPVGVVSRSYSLAPHREVATLCRKGLIDTGIEPTDLRYQVGLSELGEWMNFRIYFPEVHMPSQTLTETSWI